MSTATGVASTQVSLDSRKGDADQKELFDWLHSLELGHHFDKFLDHGYEDLGICMEIGESDCIAIGLSDIHERLALLQAVRQLGQKHHQQQNGSTKYSQKGKSGPLPALPTTATVAASSIPPPLPPNYHHSMATTGDSMSIPPMTSSLYSSWNPPNFLNNNNKNGRLNGHNNNNNNNNQSSVKLKNPPLPPSCQDLPPMIQMMTMDQQHQHHQWTMAGGGGGGEHPCDQLYLPGLGGNYQTSINYRRYHKSQPNIGTSSGTAGRIKKPKNLPLFCSSSSQVVTNGGGGISYASPLHHFQQQQQQQQNQQQQNIFLPCQVQSLCLLNSSAAAAAAASATTTNNTNNGRCHDDRLNGVRRTKLDFSASEAATANYVDVVEDDDDDVDNNGRHGNRDHDDDDEEKGNGDDEPVYESVSPFHENRGGGSGGHHDNNNDDSILLCPYAIPLQIQPPKHFQDFLISRGEESHIRFQQQQFSQTISGISYQQQQQQQQHQQDDEESLSSGGGGGGSGGCCGVGRGSESANLILLKAQLIQDGINISRISDESIIRSMAAQYAAELASTLTLTPSSTSSSSSSNSSCLSGGSSSSAGGGVGGGGGGNSSIQTPADLHYEKVFHQLRELWLEERMKLCPRSCRPGGNGLLLDDRDRDRDRDRSSRNGCGNCSSGDMICGGGGVKSSSASTPAGSASTPGCECDGFSSQIQNQNQNMPLGNSASVPCLLPGCNSSSQTTATNATNANANPNAGIIMNNSNGNGKTNSVLMSDSNSNSICKSPDRSIPSTHPHQYLQHVIISNSSFGQQQQHQQHHGHHHHSYHKNKSHHPLQPLPSNNSVSGSNSKSPIKQKYTPGIYLPSSCLVDKDEIYDYAPPVRISPEKKKPITTTTANSLHHHQNHYSPSKRCFIQPKGSTTPNSPRNPNGIATISIRGCSKSSYALSSISGTTQNNSRIYGSNYEGSPGSASGGGVKPGCRTLANLSKLTRRIFRTLRIHGGHTVASRNSSVNMTKPLGGGGAGGGGIDGQNGNAFADAGFYSSRNGGFGGSTSVSLDMDGGHLQNSERIAFSHYNKKGSAFSQNNSTLPDLTKNGANNCNGASSGQENSSMASLPSNERIIETINRLKYEELQRRKERLSQEIPVRDTLFYISARN